MCTNKIMEQETQWGSIENIGTSYTWEWSGLYELENKKTDLMEEVHGKRLCSNYGVVEFHSRTL